MKAFRLERTGEILNPVKHSIDVLGQHRDCKIYVGTDSQNKRRCTLYATVIAYRYGTRGVHYIFHREKVGKIRDKYTRLWKEVEMSLQVADLLTNNSIGVHSIDLDFNKEKTAGSNFIVSSAAGYCVGMGYKVNLKPDAQIATRAADHLVR